MPKINLTTDVEYELDVTLKCADCGAELQGEFDGDDVIEVKPHCCNGSAGFYTEAVAHDFRKLFGDDAADWLELQKMLFVK